ncbi:hypothetical protein F5X96DRAFT_94718 [Biscogniauxia mediterranea]|nr:hypothetical protein F5X96DRAFT_94718 [Biscogniauxia mediterranea]
MASNSGSSRQKSCNACVKGKRRCDKKTPSCGRCIKKRHLCIYAGQIDKPPFDDSADAARALDTFTDPTSTSSGDDFVLDPTSFSASLEANLSLSPNTTFQFGSAFDALMGNVPHVGLNDSSWHSPCHLLSHPQPQMSPVPAPDPAEKTLTITDYLKMSQMCDDYEPWQLADPSIKIAFTMSVFKKFHTGFAQNNCTAFLHRYLYKDKMPRCILQVFSMCLLYTNQTEANRGPLLRILHMNVTELKEMAGGTSLTPQEKLARVHALLFYQTIRMFDGDITLGQEADDDMALLESWNTELCKMRDNLDELVTMDHDICNKPPESWERWIFAESLRKTCIIGFSLKTFWDLLKRRPGYDGVGNWAYVHRWTLSSYLWDAPSSFDFFRAWKEKPMWVISAFKFEEFVKHGMGDDIDEFSRYFLTIYFGVDEIKTFYYETSGRVLT